MSTTTGSGLTGLPGTTRSGLISIMSENSLTALLFIPFLQGTSLRGEVYISVKNNWQPYGWNDLKNGSSGFVCKKSKFTLSVEKNSKNPNQTSSTFSLTLFQFRNYSAVSARSSSGQLCQ